MTEVPEHLLARAREARARLTGEGGDAGDDTAAAETAPAVADAAPAAPTPAAAAAVTPAEPPPPEPVAPYVEAAQARKKVPIWIVPVLVFLPIWAIYYVGLLEPPDQEEAGLFVEGEVVYAQCSSCHGATGAGGPSGRQLNEGEVLLTFPSLEAGASYDGLASQISWVINGTQGSQALGLSVYGDPDREGGARAPGSFGQNMGGFGALSVEEMLAVVHYERVQHGGLDAEAAEIEEAVLEHVVEEAEATGLVWESQTPEEIAEILDEARAAVGAGGETAAE